MSDHLKNSLKLIGIGLGLGLVLYVYMSNRWGNNSPKLPHVLKPNDKEAISVDTLTHTVTIQTPTGTKTEYVRNPIVHIDKNGVVTIERKVWGFERSPFLGISYGDGARLNLGVSWLYVYRFDLNTHIAVTLDDAHATHAIALITSVSYNFWRNTNVFVGTDLIQTVIKQTPQYHVGIFVRF